MKPLIILDRDGVINADSTEFIKTPDEWQPIPGSLEAIARLNQAGYQVVVATNQSGIARGLYDVTMLNLIHSKMLSMLKNVGGDIERVFYCPHGPWDGCQCRKPKSGLFEQIQRYFNRPLMNVPAVGDSLRDCQAACKLGCRPFLVKTGKGEETALKHAEILKQMRAVIKPDLASVVDYLLSLRNPR